MIDEVKLRKHLRWWQFVHRVSHIAAIVNAVTFFSCLYVFGAEHLLTKYLIGSIIHILLGLGFAIVWSYSKREFKRIVVGALLGEYHIDVTIGREQ